VENEPHQKKIQAYNSANDPLADLAKKPLSPDEGATGNDHYRYQR
jgi:hypothetical protein